MEIHVIEDFIVKRVVITMVNGGIDASQKEHSFQKGDIIKSESSSPSSLDSHINITMHDSSTIMEVPVSKITYKNPASHRRKSSGCGGCGKTRI